MALKVKLGRLTGPLNSCEWCDFTSRSWHLFEQHLNRCQHSESANAAVDSEHKKSNIMKRKRNYRCDSCDFHAPRPKPLLLHVKEAHQPELEIFSCELCNYASRFKTKVTQHKKVAHPESPSVVPSISSDQTGSGLNVESVDVNMELSQVASFKADDLDTKHAGKKRKPKNPRIEDNKSDIPKKNRAIKRLKLSKELLQEAVKSDCSVNSSVLPYLPLPETSLVLNSDKPNQDYVTKSKPLKKLGSKIKDKGLAAGSAEEVKLIIKYASVNLGDDGTKSKIVRYKCQLCSFIHSRKLSVAKHLRSIHGKKSGQSIAQSKAESSTRVLKRNKRKYKCTECLYRGDRKRDFLEHRVAHVISSKYACHLCSFSSNSESAVLLHKTEHHRRNESPNPSTPNEDKNLDLDSFPPQLEKYSPAQSGSVLTGTNTSLLSCDLCSAVFSYQSEVSKHMSAAHPDCKLFKCSLCPLAYKSQRYLNVHWKQKHGFCVGDTQQLNIQNEADNTASLPYPEMVDNPELLPKLEKFDNYEASDTKKEEGKKMKEKKPRKAKRKRNLSKSKHAKSSKIQNNPTVKHSDVLENWQECDEFEINPHTSTGCSTVNKDNAAAIGSISSIQNQPEILVMANGTRSSFFCIECDAKFSNRTSLECHLSRRHPGSVLYYCPVCCFSCLWRLSMKNHLKTHKKISKSVENHKYLLEQSFNLNGVTPLAQQPKAATESDTKDFGSLTESVIQVSADLDRNRKSKLPKSVLKGRKTVKRKLSLSNGIKREIKEEVMEDIQVKPLDKKKADKLYCVVCDVICDSHLKLARHKERHANLRRFMCSVCGVRSNWDFYIRNHLQKSHKAGNATLIVLSPEEAKLTISDYQQRMHAGNHGQRSQRNQSGAGMSDSLVGNDDNGLDCQKDDRCDLEAEITSAVSNPEPEKDFPVEVLSSRRKYLRWVCDQCTYATDSPAKLSSHKEVHNNLKRFMCPVCGKRSNWFPYIQTHIQKAHRSSKAEVVELSPDVAQSTLSEYLMQSSKHLLLPKARKGKLKLNKSKHKGKQRSKVTTFAEVTEMMKSEASSAKTNDDDDDKLPLHSSDLAPNSAEGHLGRSSQGQVLDMVMGDSLTGPKDLSLLSNELQGAVKKSSKTNGSKIGFCRYKKYQCADCGMRSNWPAALRRHKLSLHPQAKTVVLSLVEAQATLANYENRLRHEILALNTIAKSASVIATMPSQKVLKRLKKSHLLKKLKLTNTLAVFGCSRCEYKSKWRSNAVKHVVSVHPDATVVKIDNNQSNEVQPFAKKLKEYSCSECGLRSELLAVVKNHIQNLHSSASILRLCLPASEKTIFLNPCLSASNLLASESCKEFPVTSAIKRVWNSSEKTSTESTLSVESQTGSVQSLTTAADNACSSLAEVDSQSPSKDPSLQGSKVTGPKNFACSGCSHRTDRRRCLLRHIRSAHPKGSCCVIHLPSQSRIAARERGSKTVRQNESSVVEQKVSAGKVGSVKSDCGLESAEGQQYDQNSTEISIYSSILDCDICPYQAPRNNQLLRHKKMHKERPGYTFECTFCPYYCPSAYCLQKHLQLHQAEPLPVTEVDLHNDHDYSQIPQVVNKKGKYACDKCPFISGNYQRFVYHKQFHRPRPSAPYKCDVCPFWVPEKKMIIQHAKLHDRFSRQMMQQNEETGIVDDVVETARVKWDIIAAKCLLVTEKTLTPSCGTEEAKLNDTGARNKASSPRSQKSFTEMWLNGSLVGSENAGHHEDNSSDVLEIACLASKRSAVEDFSTNGRSKENDSDTNKVDHSSVSNASGEFDLPATRSWHCEKCPYLTITLINFKRHMSLHGSQQRYECQFCDYSVPRYYLLLQHRKLHFAPNRNLLFCQPISSLQCIAQVEDASEEYLKEITFVPSASDPTFFEDSAEFRMPSKLFRCEECPYSSLRHKSLIVHQKHHAVLSAYPCPYCTYSVNDQWRLNSHIMEHFNLPGSEMSAYSALEAADLLETMKAEILKVSLKNATSPVKDSDDTGHFGEHMKEEKAKTDCLELKQDFYVSDKDLNIQISMSDESDLKFLDDKGTVEESLKPDCPTSEHIELVPKTDTVSQERSCENSQESVEFVTEQSAADIQLSLDVELIRDLDSDEDRGVSDAESVLPAGVIIHEPTASVTYHQGTGEEVESCTYSAVRVNFACDAVVEEKQLLSGLVVEEVEDSVELPTQVNPVVCIIDSPILGNVIVTSREESETFLLSEVESTSSNQVSSCAVRSEDEGKTQDGDDGSQEENVSVLFISESDSELTRDSCVEVQNGGEEDTVLPQKDVFAFEENGGVAVEKCSELEEQVDEDFDDFFVEVDSDPEQEVSEPPASNCSDS